MQAKIKLFFIIIIIIIFDSMFFYFQCNNYYETCMAENAKGIIDLLDFFSTDAEDKCDFNRCKEQAKIKK